MGAPSGAYSEKTFELHNVGVVKYDNLIALKLLEYGSDIKSLFYLDVLFMVGNEGFVGAVQEGSFNASMHASPRVGKGRLKRSTDGVVFIMMNDAGLNTFADCNFIAFSQMINNGVITTFNISSSYYSDTSSSGIRIRKSGGSWSSIDVGEALPRKDFKQYSISSNQFDVGDVVEVEIWAINEEGERHTSILSYTVERFEIKLQGPATWPSQAGPPLVSYWTDKYDLTGIVYNSKTTSSIITSGYYQTDMNSWVYIDGTGMITDGGGIGVWPPGDPAAPVRFIPISFLGRADDSGSQSWEWACANINDLTPLNCYFDNVTQNYCYTTTNNGTDIIQRGFWYISSDQFIFINNGKKIQDGNCTDGPIIT